MLEITDGMRVFAINKKQANDLELKLNISYYGGGWSDIGDILFDFSMGRHCVPSIRVFKEQYNFLHLLMTMAYEDCESFSFHSDVEHDPAAPGTD